MSMHIYNYKRYSLLVFIISNVVAMHVQASQCPFNTKQANMTDVMAYLHQSKDALTSSCVVQALDMLRRTNDKAVLPLIAQYLDYEVVDEPGVARVVRASLTRGVYPAVDEMAYFDKDALPILRKILLANNPSVSKTALINASRLVLFVERDKPKAIGMIMSSVMKVNQDAEVRSEIFDLLQKAVSRCPPDVYKSCVEALSNK